MKRSSRIISIDRVKVFPFLVAFCCAALTTDGCGVLRMYDTVKIRYNDWIMYGGNQQRTNATAQDITLPLVQLWEYDAGAGFGTSAVAVADSLIFAGTLQGELHVVRLRNGKPVGTVDLGTAIAGTPIVSGDVVYVPMTRNEYNLICFNLLRGSPDWRAKIGDIETSTLLIDTRLYVTTMQGMLLCFDQRDGAIIWTFEIPAREGRKPIRSSPAADENTIYFGADDGKLYAVSRGEGKLIWTFTTKGAITATPSVHDKKIYFGSTDEGVYCLDDSSGALVWKRNVGSQIYGSHAVDGERVFATAADGHVYCFDAASGELRWRFRANSVINAAPVVAGTIVFVGSLDKTLYALDTRSGQLLWSQPVPSRIKSSPVVWHEYLIVPVEDRSILVFKSKEGKPS